MITTSPWRGGIGKEGNDEDEGFFSFDLCMSTVSRSMILYDFLKMNNVIVSQNGD